MSDLAVSRIDALIAEQEGLVRIDRETIKAIQLKKLNRLLERENERGRFYRALPERLRSLEEITFLPFTTEEDLVRDPGALLLCSQSQISRVITDVTSGTTGAAKRVFYTEDDIENTIRLYMAGLGELVFPGSVTLICFPFTGPFGLGELISEAISRLGARPLKTGPYFCYGEYAELLEREQPDTFVGMPAQLLGLLRCCGQGSLRHALVSGDACPESVMLACEDILGSRLFPHYGSREMGMAGAICCQAHEGMHLRENHIIAEIIDEKGDPLPAGEYGELVITTIGMEAMPLIRYRTGDYTRILPEPCPCGSTVLRLDRLERKSDGLSASELDGIMFADPHIVDCSYELRQGTVEITVLIKGEIDIPALQTRLSGKFDTQTFEIVVREAKPGDHFLYKGKRTLIRT